MFGERLARVQGALEDSRTDALLLSVGPDLPWLIGYEAMPLERLTMLVVPRGGRTTLVVPALEAPRVVRRPDLFDLRPWTEIEDPLEIVTELLGSARSVAIGDHTWSRFLVDLLQQVPGLVPTRSAGILGPLRAVKDAGEVHALRNAAAAADRVAADLQTGAIPLVGRSESEVSAELGRRLLDEGHQRVNFAIVAAGENSASPHHEPGARRIERGDVVLCDFGGTMADGEGVPYCSDITRCVHVGPPPPELVELYDVLRSAQAAGVAASRSGVTAQSIDAATAAVITEGGFGHGILHRTGHGIGVEAHEDPYLVAGSAEVLETGNVFSIEPGIYLRDRWGARIEDIVVVTADGPDPLNRVDHGLAVVNG